MLHNHNTGRVLGRTPKTLRVQADERGLAFELDVPAHAMDVFEAVQRGDTTTASFAFSEPQDTWDSTGPVPIRTIHRFRLREISVWVPFSAYPSTSVSAARRSLETFRAQALKETLVADTATVTVTDPIPVVPPVVTDRNFIDDTEVRVLGRDESVRSWVEERTRRPKEYGRLRLGDVCAR